jgi:hypothetical protein
MKNIEIDDKFLEEWSFKRKKQIKFIMVNGGITGLAAFIIQSSLSLLLDWVPWFEFYNTLPIRIIGWTFFGFLEGWIYFIYRESEFKRIMKSRNLPIPDRK